MPTNSINQRNVKYMKKSIITLSLVVATICGCKEATTEQFNPILDNGNIEKSLQAEPKEIDYNEMAIFSAANN